MLVLGDTCHSCIGRTVWHAASTRLFASHHVSCRPQLCAAALLLPALLPEGTGSGVMIPGVSRIVTAVGAAVQHHALRPLLALVGFTAALAALRRLIDRTIAKFYGGSWPPPRNVKA